jgi:hypothetical protein
MKTGKKVILLVAGMIVVGSAGGMAIENLPRGTSKTAALALGVGITFVMALLGFVVIFGSLKGGWSATRYWFGGLIGIAVATVPFAILPVPWLLLVSIPAGIAIGSLIATGKVWKVWEE